MYDRKNLSEMKHLGVHAPEALNACVAFGKATFAEGAIPRTYKELRASPSRSRPSAPYCIEPHCEQGAGDRRVGPRDRRIRAGRCGGARGWGGHPRHACHEGSLNGRLDCT